MSLNHKFKESDVKGRKNLYFRINVSRLSLNHKFKESDVKRRKNLYFRIKVSCLNDFLTQKFTLKEIIIVCCISLTRTVC